MNDTPPRGAGQVNHVLPEAQMTRPRAIHIIYCKEHGCTWRIHEARIWLENNPERTTMNTHDVAEVAVMDLLSGNAPYMGPRDIAGRRFLQENIVIPRTDLPALETEPAPSGNGVTYVHSAGECHSSITAGSARTIALEWLAIADDMEKREHVETARKDEIAREFGERDYSACSKAPAGRMIDRIYELEQQAGHECPAFPL